MDCSRATDSPGACRTPLSRVFILMCRSANYHHRALLFANNVRNMAFADIVAVAELTWPGYAGTQVWNYDNSHVSLVQLWTADDACP
jgi:hypothetical protein